jgi:uncharacterized protein (TIGR02444 family)
MPADDAAALWRFSLAFYARPGVADALIALQDRDGRDVGLILYALWQGLRGRRLAADLGALAAAAAAPAALAAELRGMRRRLKSDAAADIAALRRRVLALELAAERAAQARLAAIVPPAAEGGRLELAAANLALCVGECGEAAILRRALAEFSRAASPRRPSA